MRIVVITQNAPLYIATFLDDFFAGLSNTSHKIVSIVVLSSTYKSTILNELVKRFRYYGPIQFVKAVVRILSNIFWACVFWLAPNVGCHSVDNVIRKYELRRYEIESVNSERFIKYVNEEKIDVVLSIAAPQVFKKKLLMAPRKGCLNYHTGLLPEYRGRQPLFWALLNNESEVGITVHEMDAEIDNGPIVAQERVSVNSDDTLDTLYLKTMKRGAPLLLAAIEKVSGGSADRIKNDSQRATYFGFPGPQDAREFRAKGKKFF